MNEIRLKKEEIYNKIFQLDPESVKHACRDLILEQRDLYFLLSRICGRKDLQNDWLYERCIEVANNPDGYLDLWARDHRKSTIITFGLTILDICKDSENIFGIFSFNNKTATSFLDQIKRECEGNALLPWLFPETFYENPKKDSPTWSLERGLTFKRKSNPKEPTISAWGLVDNMPTGYHFTHMVYDDVVTKDSVTSADMIMKVTQAWEMSLNLESTRDGKRAIRRMIGTRYAYGDTWQHIIDRGAAIARKYPCKDERGKPVFLTEAILKEKQKEMGNTFYSQMMLDPKADSPKGFKRTDIRYYDEINVNKMNLYMLCDPANSLKKGSDWTVMLVIGLAAPDNYYLVDAVRDRLSLPQRIHRWIELHRKWYPKSKIIKAGYEGYGKDADIDAIEMQMDREGYKFDIQKLKGRVSKADRIDWLLPMTEDRKLYLPRSMHKTIYDGSTMDLIEYFIEHELMTFPVSEHDDFLDCLARIKDPEFKTKFPLDRKVSMKINYPKLASIA